MSVPPEEPIDLEQWRRRRSGPAADKRAPGAVPEHAAPLDPVEAETLWIEHGL
jgi:hypothetical protein